MTDPTGQPAAPSWSAASDGGERAALASRMRPSLVLEESKVRQLLREAGRYDVACTGRFSAGPAGVQVWTGPFDGLGGTRGSAVHLGSVDWTYDTPARGYATVYRCMVTDAGVQRGESTGTILAHVLGLGEIQVDGPRLDQQSPPARDPFRGR